MSASRKESIYIIAHDGDPPTGPIKIGVSRDVAARLKGIQTSNPRPLMVYKTIELHQRSLSELFEQEAHKTLRDRGDALVGEWFDVEPKVAAALLAELYEWMMEYMSELVAIYGPPNGTSRWPPRSS